MRIIGEVIKIDKDKKFFYLRVPLENKIKSNLFKVSYINKCSLSNNQRRKIYALIKDISEYIGYPLEVCKMILKLEYMNAFNLDYFSLSTTTKNNARNFITFLIDYILKNDIPCQESLVIRCEDIDRYLYSCLLYKSCAICGKPAELHHNDVVGTGRNRKNISHLGLKATSLCRKHHNIYHNIGEYEFNKKYHVYGIKLDEVLCKRYNLKC